MTHILNCAVPAGRARLSSDARPRHYRVRAAAPKPAVYMAAATVRRNGRGNRIDCGMKLAPCPSRARRRRQVSFRLDRSPSWSRIQRRPRRAGVGRRRWCVWSRARSGLSRTLQSRGRFPIANRENARDQPIRLLCLS